MKLVERYNSRIDQLAEEIYKKFPSESRFENFRCDSIAEKSKRNEFQKLNNELEQLPESQWMAILPKLVKHAKTKDGIRGNEPLFDHLHEVFAYNFLIKRGANNVQFITEDNKEKHPDISFMVENIQMACEVKTVNVSSDELEQRSRQDIVDCSKYAYLKPEFFYTKIAKGIEKALEQSKQYSSNPMIFFVVKFDDISEDNVEKYRSQIYDFIDSQSELVIFYLYRQREHLYCKEKLGSYFQLNFN